MVVFLYDGRALSFRFKGVDLLGGDGTENDLQSLAYAVGATYVTDHWGTIRTQIRAQEVDLADDGRYILRLRLWPFYEFEITFRDLTLSVEPPPSSEAVGNSS